VTHVLGVFWSQLLIPGLGYTEVVKMLTVYGDIVVCWWIYCVEIDDQITPDFTGYITSMEFKVFGIKVSRHLWKYM